MEARQTNIHVLRPIADETLDTTNKCIRRVFNCAVFYDEEEVSAEEIADGMIGQEMTFALPPAEEQHTYYLDDVVFTSPHRARLHLSRELTA